MRQSVTTRTVAVQRLLGRGALAEDGAGAELDQFGAVGLDLQPGRVP